MKVPLTIFLVMSFFGVAVFGVFAMLHSFGHSHEGCIAAAAQGVGCPEEENAISFFNFHLGAFHSFSTATFGENFATVLLLIVLVLAIATGTFFCVHSAALAPAGGDHQKRLLDSRLFSFQRALTRWLALHENSPATL